jgi:hypothetical protein
VGRRGIAGSTMPTLSEELTHCASTFLERLLWPAPRAWFAKRQIDEPWVVCGERRRSAGIHCPCRCRPGEWMIGPAPPNLLSSA